MIIRNYYTFEEIFSEYSHIIKDDLELGNPVTPGGEKLIADFAFKVAGYASSYTAFNNNEMNTLLCTYIYPKYKDMVAYYVDKDDDSEPTSSEINAAFKDFGRKLLNRMRTSYEEYKYLIDTLTAQKTHLMDDIKSTTFNKYNDTPQGSGDFSGDTHATNVSIGSSTTEGATKIARIAEIENNIKDYYEKWCEVVCGGLFIYER